MDDFKTANGRPATVRSFGQSLFAKIKSLKRSRQVLLAVLLLLVVFLAYGCWYFYRVLRPEDLFDKPPLPHDDGAANPVPAQTGGEKAEGDFSTNIVSVVLLGFDGNRERDSVYSIYRTDTIKIFAVDFDKKTVRIIDIPRDSYTRIADTQTYDKINHAYYYGHQYVGEGDRHLQGIEYTLRSISNLLGGIPLQYYVTVNMDAVVGLVDSIGGVRFNVPYDVYDEDGVLQLKKGETVLNGEQYLHYLRNREKGGDEGRMKRQTELLLATLDHLRAEGLVKNLPTLYNTYKDLIDTNLTNQQVISLLLFAARLERDRISTYTLTGSGQSKDGIYYMVLPPEAIAEVLRDVYGIDFMPEAQEPLRDTVPAVPKAFSAVVVDHDGGRAVSLSWQKGDSRNRSFKLYRSTDGGEKVLLAETQELSWLDTQVSAGEICTYYLEAVNHRALSPQISLTVTIEGAPQPPGEEEGPGGEDMPDGEEPPTQEAPGESQILPEPDGTAAIDIPTPPPPEL